MAAVAYRALVAAAVVSGIARPSGAHEFSLEWANGCCATKYGGSCVARPDHPDPQCQAGHEALGLGPSIAPFWECIDVGCLVILHECIPLIPTGSVADVPNGVDDDCDGVIDGQFAGSVESRLVNLEWANDCCATLFDERCDARPQHPDPRCKAGRLDAGPGAASGSLLECFGTSCAVVGPWCEPDIPTGALGEAPNDIDDDCDGYIDDEQCDGIDNDSDGQIDDDVGSCLLKLLFVPLCFDGNQADFEAAVAGQMSFFLDSLALTDCASHISNFLVDVSQLNLSCPTGADDPICTAEVNRWRDEAIAALPGIPGADTASYNGIVALTNRNICGRIEGVNNGGDFIWSQTDSPVVVTHEVGHSFGLDDEYCSVQAGGPRPCNDATSPNFLGADLGCDPEPTGCCGVCTEYAVCCQGNRNSQGGRCVMSYANAGGPRAFCDRCLSHLTEPPNPRSETNPNGSLPLTCAFTHIGQQPVLSLEYAITLAGVPRIESLALGTGRTALGGELEGGQYTTEIRDALGNRLFRTSYDLPYGPYELGAGASPTEAAEYYDRGLKIAVPSSITDSSQLKVVIYSDGTPTGQTTLNGVAPEVDAGPEATLDCTSPYGAVTTVSATASDADGDSLSYRWSAPAVTFTEPTSATTSALFPIGSTVATVDVTDGLLHAAATTTITVTDAAPPAFREPRVSPGCLWPVNHEYVRFELGANLVVEADDPCDLEPPLVRIVGVTSNEPDDGAGDGHTAPDVVFDGASRFCLRAERSGLGRGRVYSVTLEATDSGGNVAYLTVEIPVGHDAAGHDCPPLPAGAFVEEDDAACAFVSVIPPCPTGQSGRGDTAGTDATASGDRGDAGPARRLQSGEPATPPRDDAPVGCHAGGAGAATGLVLLAMLARRRRNRALLVALSAAVVVAPGCDSQVAPARVESAVAFLCDPASPSTCGAGSRCDAGCADAALVVGCRPEPAQAQPVGAPCSKDAPCGAGSTCVATSAAGARCARFCSAAAPCEAGETCVEATVAYRCSESAVGTSVKLYVCR